MTSAISNRAARLGIAWPWLSRCPAPLAAHPLPHFQLFARAMSAPPGPLFSLVAPTYNESANIGPFIERACTVLDAWRPGDYELIVVDDDSPDRTWQLATAAAASRPQVRVVRRTDARGLATAVVAGWQVAQGRWLGVIDADLQHPPEVLVRLLAAMAAGADLVVGSRNVANGGVSTWSLWRRLVSRTAGAIAFQILPVVRRVRDPMSGLFIVRRDRVDLASLQPVGYKILLEVLIRSRVEAITEVGYVFEERRQGGSKATAAIYCQYLAHLFRLRRAGR